MMYIRIVEGDLEGAKKINLVPYNEDVFKAVAKRRNHPWYYSTYYYNEQQAQTFRETRSVAGIDDVTTDKIWWDFDSTDPSETKKSVETLVNRLVTDFPTTDPDTQIKIQFSGGKGFHVILQTDLTLKPKEVEAFAKKYAGDLLGFDTSLYDANQLLRMPTTKHNRTEAYCYPLTYNEFISSSMDDIKKDAENLKDFDYDAYTSHYKTFDINMTHIPKVSTPVETSKPTVVSRDFDLEGIDFSKKPKYLDEARWCLMNGFFRGSETTDVGERNNAFLCLAATFKNLGFEREHVRGLLQGVAEIQASRTGESEYPDRELDTHILNTVYSNSWKGGQFTTRDPNNWLAKYSVRLGIKNKEVEGPSTLGDIETGFTNFIMNIEKNTIKTGIDQLDKTMPITVGSNIGIVAGAGVGKTALALKILRYNSEQGIQTVFASLDMHRNRLFEKVVYNVTGISRDELYHSFKTGKGKAITDLVRKHYGNVWFYDRSSASIADIRNYVQEVEQKTGEKVKMVMIDYFERVTSDIADDTSSSKKIAGEIQDMVNDLNIAAVTLCQPNKFSLGAGPDTELKSYTAIKGSSFLYQSFRGIISLSRPFYTPETTELDKYLIMNVLKNDLGELARLKFGWNGKKGDIYPLEDIEMQELNELLKMKQAIKKEEGSGGWD